jgi:quinone-modifying oxidoreductase subunit QmoC
VLRSILVHDRFAECETRASRRWTHLLAFYGFLALFVVTVYAVLDLYVFPAVGLPSKYPFSLEHPAKWLANAGAVLLIVGSAKAILDRSRPSEAPDASTAFDWIFAWLLLVVGVTGLVVEILRFVAQSGGSPGLQATAYSFYFVHLVVVFGLLVYLPYSKFAHILYRSVALVYAEHTGRIREARPARASAG